MGGSNSTRWDAIRTRSAVESCFSISAPRLDPEIRGGPSLDDELRWEKANFSVSCSLWPDPDTPRVELRFRRYGENKGQLIGLCSTRPHLGGLRWWYACPECSARVALLHLPRGSYHFLCRGCHDLSYESAQCSRSLMSRFWLKLAAEEGCSTRQARDRFRARRGGHVWRPQRPVFL